MSKRETLKRLLSYLLNDKAGFAVAAIFLLFAVVADVSGPWLIRIFLDDYVAQDYYPPNVLWGLALAYIAVTVLSGLLHYAYGIRFSRIAIEIVQTIRKRVYASIINQPLHTSSHLVLPPSLLFTASKQIFCISIIHYHIHLEILGIYDSFAWVTYLHLMLWTLLKVVGVKVAKWQSEELFVSL